ncbi:MAG: TetR/AcrR family transcriptional regulator [Rhodospirillales bacterium]|nr:TetR/AcrR family transcriptional regulator [Rhodospirillales bacterium]
MARPVTTKARARATYRHGDLRRALLEAGIALARDGGPEAVVLREATRRAGVVPNAAYRHFASRQDLLNAVRAAALAAVARAMEAELAAVPEGTPEEVARFSLRAIGLGYLRFAEEEPGLFRTAFAVPGGLEVGADPSSRGESGLGPFQLLGDALDKMVAAGLLPPERRPGAEFLAWSAVHGFAMLVLEGPLHGFGPAERREIGARVIEMVEKGLEVPRPAVSRKASPAKRGERALDLGQGEAASQSEA